MKTSDFDYDLPEELIAQHPAAERDESRMLYFERRSGDLRETRFSNFPRFLREGDILVVNETRVIPARLIGRRASGGQVEIFLTRRIGGRRWSALLRPARRIASGETILFGEGELGVTVEGAEGGEWIVSLPDEMPSQRFINLYGRVPLPPYIRREANERDHERYQTLFARREGSVAAPTAGLHFSDAVLRDLRRRGITIAPVTLHVGPGTFRPLEKERVEENTLGRERFSVRQAIWEEIRAARETGRRVVAVGTTTTRVLESLAGGHAEQAKETEIDGEAVLDGWTRLFIYPGFRFQVVDSLLTNFHLPRSSLLVLVSAFAGREETLRAYRWAVARRFRFYSYGDVMFIK
ncbi:MAG: tRNA preQ1(34) S-adenosylmethionine ribosyltransferase-isomerase QueA [Candidatus Krumholzibacteriota bacterium]|nr:tRNA preQ1(34) S-adenosylmethionine ribosyltransferase-isomerase QueA [Candidatus Krumholzibacteriota bacterium]